MLASGPSPVVVFRAGAGVQARPATPADVPLPDDLALSPNGELVAFRDSGTRTETVADSLDLARRSDTYVGFETARRTRWISGDELLVESLDPENPDATLVKLGIKRFGVRPLGFGGAPPPRPLTGIAFGIGAFPVASEVIVSDMAANGTLVGFTKTAFGATQGRASASFIVDDPVHPVARLWAAGHLDGLPMEILDDGTVFAQSFVVLPDGRLGGRDPAPLSAPVPEFEYADALARLEKGHNASFRNAVVIVGASDQGQRADDMHATLLGDRSGAQVVASAIRTLSEPDARQILPAPFRLEALSALLTALLTASLAVRPGMVKSLALPTLGIATSGLVAATVASVLGGSRLLPTWVRYRWSTREGEIAALFIDVENSTALLGRLHGGHRAFLETVQDAIAGIVDRHGGHIERTMGDGAFAVFRTGSPTVRAQACLATMRALADRFAKDAPAYLDRFGAVPVLVLGAEMANVEGAVLTSRGREEFATFGRDIAFAQRVQAAAKAMETRCAIGPRLTAVCGADAGVLRTHSVVPKGYDEAHLFSEITATPQWHETAGSDPP